MPSPRQRGWLSRVSWVIVVSLLFTVLFTLQKSYDGRPLRDLRALPPPLPWESLLTAGEVQRGISYYGGGARLRRVAQKLLDRKPIKVFTLGGSVTYGHGVEDAAQSYPSLFFRFINETFPHRDHVLSNIGMPGSNSQVTTPCIESMIAAADPDFVSVEFTVNDSPTAFTSSARTSFEEMLRRLLAYPSSPAVVLLHHYPWWKAEGDGLTRGLFYREPEGQMTTFSQYYDIPSLSLRAAAWQLMAAGIPGFKVDKLILEGNRVASTGEAIPTADSHSQADYLYIDTIHPGPNGHQVLAELLAGLLRRALGEVASGQEAMLAPREHSRLAGLPPPMIPNYEENRASACLQLEAFKPVVKRQRGFEYRPEKPALPAWVEQKWGWSGSEPGAWAELEVDTRPAAGTRARRTSLVLSHLKSYTGMGTAAVECVSGCSCERSTLDGTTPSHVSIFKTHSFKVSRHERCRVRVTISAAPGATPQEGHKVMLAAVMVTHKVK